MKKNIVLVGFMGSGKTTNGRRLARKMGKQFVDTDMLIEEKNNMPIEKIFKKYGEDYFRKLEHQMVQSLSNEQNKIISTGGGIILNSDNMDILKKNGIVVYLKSTPENLCHNLKNSYKKRPLIQKKNWEEVVKELLIERKEVYESNADIVIEVTGKKHMQIVGEIFNQLREKKYI